MTGPTRDEPPGRTAEPTLTGPVIEELPTRSRGTPPPRAAAERRPAPGRPEGGRRRRPGPPGSATER